MFSKLFTITIVLTAVLLTTASSLAQEDVITLKWWTIPGHDFGDEETQRELIGIFEAAHPNIKIDLTVLPVNGYEDRMTTVLATGGEGGPDIAPLYDPNWAPQAVDLTPYIEAQSDISSDMYFERAWANRAVSGDRIVALPLGMGANIVLFNKDVFDAAGVDYPTADWTTEDFIEIAVAVSDPETRTWGGDRPRGPFRAIFNNYGAFPYSDDSTTVDGYYNSDASLAAFTWFWDLVDSGATPTPADIDILGTEGTGPIDLFISGRLAMATLNQTHLLEALKAGINFGAVPEPQVVGNARYVNSWSGQAAIWSWTEHPDESWEWLKFWAGPEGQRHLMENGLNLFPAIPDLLEDHPFAHHEATQVFFTVLELPQVADWEGQHPCWRASVSRVGSAWDLINLGEIARDEIAAQLDADVPVLQTALDGCVPRLGG